MFQGSLLGLAASAIYALVLFICTIAAASSFVKKQPRAHLVRWGLLAALFAVLIVSRLFGIEEGLREDWRSAIKASQLYETRREFQRPVAAIVLVLGALGAFAMIAQTVRLARSRRNLYVGIASLSGLTMAALVAFRLISLSPVDKLLYGPLKLNWIVDVGCSFAVFLAAIAYLNVIRNPRR